MKQKLLLLFVVTMLFCFSANAQNKTITGKVIDADDGKTIPGVSILYKETGQSTQTSNNGSFSIVLPSNAQTLTFSYLGYTTQTVSVAANMTVNLKSESKSLSAVVVVAYGSVKKESITGSVASIDRKELDKHISTNITNSLAGLAPGVVTTSGNGQPGVGSAVRVRGFGSISASNSPLYVVDGSVYDGAIGDINQDDIESISLLKDASSSALYGARAANGVVIISTKKGKVGAPGFNVNLSQGYSTRGIKEYDRVDAYQYYPLMWQALRNSLVYPATGVGQTPAAAATQASNTIQAQLIYNPFGVPNNQIVGTDGALNPNAKLQYDDFDWYSPLTRTGKRTEANLNSSGNSGKTDHYLSLGYLKDNGYIMKTDFQRFNARVNANAQIKPWLKTGVNLSGSLSNGNVATDAATGNSSAIANVFNFSRGIGPIYPVHAYTNAGVPIINDKGEHWYDYGLHPGAVNRPQGATPGRNVIAESLLNDNQARRLAVNARTYVEVKFLKDFTFRPTFSTDFINEYDTQFYNPVVGDGNSTNGLSYKSSEATQSYTFNQLLSYDKTFGNHQVSALAGHENYDYDYRGNASDKTNQILVGNTEFDNFVELGSTSGYKDVYHVESYFGKASYNYMQKYYIDGSVRRDGSSRFARDSRWGTFFSAGASWSIIKENFMTKLPWISDLRLKASYGEVGNDNLLLTGLAIPTPSYYNYQAFYDLDYNNGSEPGLLLSSAATPELKWESVNTFNTGLTFGFFNNRLRGEVEYFKRGSSNLLYAVPQPQSNPVASIRKNVGSMYNTGIDLQVAGELLKAKNFSWTMITNWSWLKNKITKMPIETPAVTSGTKRLEVGQDLYAFYLRQWAGVDPLDGAGLFEPNAGVTTDLRTVDGRVLTTNINNARSDYSGSAIPDLYGSVNNLFTYKNFTFSFLITYQIGGKFLDQEYQGLMGLSYGSAIHADAAKSWTTPGQVTDIPRLDIARTTVFNGTSSRFLMDASYINFKNANLSFELPKSWLQYVEVANARIFVAAENLALISKRKGMNPTESFNGLNDSNYLPSRNISFGIKLSL
jgi:TonB-linked SusC/RagA family outer membrane protein